MVTVRGFLVAVCSNQIQCSLAHSLPALGTHYPRSIVLGTRGRSFWWDPLEVQVWSQLSTDLFSLVKEDNVVDGLVIHVHCQPVSSIQWLGFF